MRSNFISHILGASQMATFHKMAHQGPHKSNFKICQIPCWNGTRIDHTQKQMINDDHCVSQWNLTQLSSWFWLSHIGTSKGLTNSQLQRPQIRGHYWVGNLWPMEWPSDQFTININYLEKRNKCIAAKITDSITVDGKVIQTFAEK